MIILRDLLNILDPDAFVAVRLADPTCTYMIHPYIALDEVINEDLLRMIVFMLDYTEDGFPLLTVKTRGWSNTALKRIMKSFEEIQAWEDTQ